MTAYVSAHMVNVHMKATASGKSATAADARRGLLHEGARSLVDEWEQKWADKNPNIRTDEAHRNVVLVQAPGDDGSYDLREATTKQEADAFIKYGNERTALLEHPPRAGYVAFSSMAFHYPKEFCDEHAGEAQAVDKDGKKIFDKNGEPVMVARYTPKDYDEMRQYFDDALDLLSDQLGGREHVHGVFIHLDERTPHMQVVFDSYQPSDNEPDKLKAGHSLLWGTHEDVCYPKGTMIRGKDMSGKRISGARKMSEFQKDLREHMAECGWDVSVKRSARHKDHYTKDEYAEIDNARIAQEQESAALDKKREDYESDVADYEVSLSELDERDEQVQEREKQLDERETKLAGERESLDSFAQSVKRGFDEQIADGDKLRAQREEQDKRQVELDNQKAAQNARAVALQKQQEAIDEEKANQEALKKQAQEEAQRIKAAAESEARQIRAQATADSNSILSTAQERVDALNGEISRKEGEVGALERKKSTLTRDVEGLETRKEKLTLADVVEDPDGVQRNVAVLRDDISQNLNRYRLAGVPGDALRGTLSAIGGVEQHMPDQRFERLANENEEKQGVRSALRDAGFGRRL